MDDLISRDAAKKIVSLMVCAPSVKILAEHSIDDLPAVDAVPVVHGLWIYFNCVGNGRYQCSECFHWVDAGTDRNYCPNCGAKMDGDANG